MAEDQPNSTLLCRLCQLEKAVTEFYNARMCACKECLKARSRKNYRENRSARLEQKRNYCADHVEQRARTERLYRQERRAEIAQRKRRQYEAKRESILEKKRAYYEQNKVRIKERRRSHYEKTRKKCLEKARKYHADNRARNNERTRRYCKSNLDGFRAYKNKRRSRKKANTAGDHFTKADILRQHEQQGGICIGPLENGEICGKRLSLKKRDFHIDHYVPLSKGGSNGSENIQLLCPGCNLRKGAEDPYVFAQSNGRLF